MINSISSATTLFAIAAVATIWLGIYITLVADEIAERTRLGRAFVGAILLGALTSAAEIGTSIGAAVQLHAELAVNNAIGSVAAQTAFLAIADLSYRRANLEHAAASVSNMMLSALLIILLSLLLLATTVSTSAWAHPFSFALLAAYLYGMYLVTRSSQVPMWQARMTVETRDDSERRIPHTGAMTVLWAKFLLVGGLLVGSGVLLAEAGIAITQLTGLSESFVGVLLTGLTSSMPELVTALTAVRIGALSLAVANIIGGNAFDTTIVAFSDLVHPGSIYANAGEGLTTLLATVLLMNGIVLLGLIRRERYGFGNIGLEGVLLLLIYAGLIGWLAG